jgi:hypothetical protein
MLAAGKRVRRLGTLRLRSAPAETAFFIISSPPSRPPEAAGFRLRRTPQKIISRAHCKKTAFYSIQILPALASKFSFRKLTRGVGLLLLLFTDIYAGGHVLIKNHPGVRCCGRRGGLFCDLFVATGGRRNC